MSGKAASRMGESSFLPVSPSANQVFVSPITNCRCRSHCESHANLTQIFFFRGFLYVMKYLLKYFHFLTTISLVLRSYWADIKGGVTRDDLQRRFLSQHGVAMLEQCCNRSKQCCNNIATLWCAKNRRCISSRVTSHESTVDTSVFLH